MSWEETAPLPALEPHEAWLPVEHPLHRPRHGGRQFTALVCAAIFFVVPALALTLGARPAEFENRRLAAFPSALDGWGFFPGLSAWANDHVPFRDAAVHAADRASRDVFGESAPLAAEPPSTHAPFVPPEPHKADTANPEVDQGPMIAGFPKVIEGDDGWLYYGLDVQGKCQPSRDLDQVIDTLKRLRAAVEASGRRFVLVVPPDKSTAVPEHLPDSYAGQRCARPVTERFWTRIVDEVGATDLREDLRRIADTDGRPPYYPLDTHWTDRGAALMVERLAEKIAPGVTAGWKLEEKRTTQYSADLPTLLGRTGVNDVQLYSLAPDGRRDRTRQPETDLTVPTAYHSSPGMGMVTPRTAILSDSYTLPATRYFAATFTDLDLVYFSTLESKPGVVLDMLVDQDVIVVEAVERNLTSGIASVTDPAVVDLISQRLAANPR